MQILSKIRFFIKFIQIALLLIFLIIIFKIFPSKIRKLRKKVSKKILKILRVKIEIKGELNSKTKMLLVNHQSILDVITLEACLPKTPLWVAKKELFKIPIYGNLLKLPNLISIDRQDRKSLIKLIKDIEARLDNNSILTLFPEGTRAKQKELLPFKLGAKIIAKKFSMDIQPLILLNSKRLLDTKHKISKKGTLKIIYMEALKHQNIKNISMEKIREDMQRVIDKAYIDGDRR